MKKLRSVLIGCWLCVAVGCGGDGGSASGCAETCQAQTDGGCNFGSTAECTEFCQAVYNASNAACRQAISATAECMLAQPDICDFGTACDAEQAAQQQACA